MPNRTDIAVVRTTAATAADGCENPERVTNQMVK